MQSNGFHHARPGSGIAAEDMNAFSANLQTNKLIFLHSDMVHNDVVARRGTFGEFIKTSCLENK